MVKLLFIPLLVVILIAGFGYYRFFIAGKNSVVSPASQSSDEPIEVPKTLPNASLEDRVKSLEETISKIADQVNTQKASQDTQAQTNTNFDSRLKALETSTADLKTKVDQQPTQNNTSTTTTSQPRSPLYIPLGSGGSSSDSNWVSINTYEISIDPQEYSGYKDMQLEVNFKLPDLVGTAYARLYNSTDSSATSSEISTTSGNYVWGTSSGFTLPSGRKTYKLQLKSSQSKEVQVQSARIKVNF